MSPARKRQERHARKVARQQKINTKNNNERRQDEYVRQNVFPPGTHCGNNLKDVTPPVENRLLSFFRS